MYKTYIKPLIDFTVALLLLLLLFPVILVTVFLVLVFLGRPIYFTQQRPGLDEKIFTIYKFRTMSDDKDLHGELLPDEQRLGKVGRTMRSLSLDELPQLLNMLKGEMSLIGPRPLLIEYLALYDEKQRHRHDVRPGITGWAQVNGRNAISWDKKFKYDVYYVNNLTWRLDLRIFWLTLTKVIKREDISSQEHVTVEKFNGNN